MTRETLEYLAGILVRLPINTGTDDWREAARKIAAAQDEIAAELQEQHGVTWAPPGGAPIPVPAARIAAGVVPVASNGAPPG